MPLPARVRVRLSTEAAGAIGMTPVVVQEMGMRELMDHLLASAGKDEARIRTILRRGSLVSGGSRLRWEGWEPEPESLRQLLATFPDDDPQILFAPARCVRAVLRGGLRPVELVPGAGRIWDLLLEIAAADLAYAGYSYRERADRYLKHLAAAEAESLRAAAGSVRFSTLRRHIETSPFHQAEFFTTRP